MTELEKLEKQKKELEQRIRQLKDEGIVIRERAKLDRDHYATSKPDEYKVCVMSRFTDTVMRREKWMPIIRSTIRDVAVGQIPLVINDLKELYKSITGEDAE